MLAEEQSLNHHLKKVKWMSQALMLSGAVNIVLLATFFYQWVHEKPTAAMEWKSAETSKQGESSALANQQVLKEYESMTLQQLVEKLHSKAVVEENYAQRDLALACLISFYDFDIDRALASQPIQKQQLAFSSAQNEQSPKMMIATGLSEAQYEQIYRFATTERWPFTAKGLFTALKKEQANPEAAAQIDPTLVDAFCLTQEFLMTELLFNRSDVAIDKKEILRVLTQGDWQTLSTFIEEQRQAQDLSPARRQKLLLDYVHQHSPAAALMLLRTDGAFVAHHLEDADTISLLEMLKEKDSAVELFAIELLNSPRSNAIWETAASRLYSFAGEALPQPFNHKAAMVRFTPKEMLHKNNDLVAMRDKPRQTPAVKLEAKATAARPAVNKVKPAVPTNIIYKVQNGDSLWKVAKKFQVSVQSIKRCNALQSDNIRPGQQLKIPHRDAQGAAKASNQR